MRHKISVDIRIVIHCLYGLSHCFLPWVVVTTLHLYRVFVHNRYLQTDRQMDRCHSQSIKLPSFNYSDYFASCHQLTSQPPAHLYFENGIKYRRSLTDMICSVTCNICILRCYEHDVRLSICLSVCNVGRLWSHSRRKSWNATRKDRSVFWALARRSWRGSWYRVIPNSMEEDKWEMETWNFALQWQ